MSRDPLWLRACILLADATYALAAIFIWTFLIIVIWGGLAFLVWKAVTRWVV